MKNSKGVNNNVQKISTRPSDSLEKKTENLPNRGLCCSSWSQGKTERKRKDLARELKNYGTWKWQWYQLKLVCSVETMEALARYSHQRIGTETVGLGNKRTSGDHPNDSIIKIGQNTEKSPGDLRKLAVTQTPGRNHQLTIVWKTLKRVK